MLTAKLLFENQVIYLGQSKHTTFNKGSFSISEQKHRLGKIVQLSVQANEPIQLQNIQLKLPLDIKNTSHFFCNGFQSWSESREMTIEEHIPNLRWFAKPIMGYYGDYHIKNIKRKKGFLHSWTYTYTRINSDRILFIGSLNEPLGFTLFQWDANQGILLIDKDCINRVIDQSYEGLHLFIAEGDEKSIFDAWAELLQMPTFPQKVTTGWTSWYNHYTNISETILLDNLQQMEEDMPEADYFQIDDGYQTAIGDWKSIKSDAFPNGMQHLAKAIKAKGFQAGLWIAPFVCESASQLYANHPEWILRDSRGRPIRAGYAPHWSGRFFALDFYHSSFQAYLRDVLNTFTKDWGFQLLKLDFLYAVCLLPRKDKTRGEILFDAIQFIVEHTHNAKLLACGAPLGPLFGLVDFCRVGADIHLKWEHNLLRFLRNRERVSTILALRTSLGRHHLNGRFFQNDPDVFILRTQNHDLSFEQQKTILQINTICGNLIFHSDELSLYDEKRKELYQWFLDWKDSQLQKVEIIKEDCYLLTFKKKQQDYIALCNLTNRPQQLFDHNLTSFETKILSKQ